MMRTRSLVIVVAITVGLVAALEGGLALCGVRPLLDDGDPYVGFSGILPLFVEEMDPSGKPGTHLVTAEDKLLFFNEQRFPKRKEKGTYRVFCLGGSTTYGHPYVHTTSFGGWLHTMLPEADSSKHWEIINAGGISYASYRVALLMEELSQYEPDLFIIYSGHNEFLERRSYPRFAEASKGAMALGTALHGLRSYAVACELRTRLGASSAHPDSAEDILASEVTAILDWANGPWAYQRDDALREKVLAHYRFNLRRMAEIAHEAGARILYVTTPVNLRDCSPFKSTHREDLPDEARAAWERLVEEAGAAKSLRAWSEAIAALDAAADIDPRHARLHYQRGEALWELGRYEEAKAAFVLASDEDVCPLRALSSMPGIVREVAREFGALLVDFDAWAETQAAQGTPGADLFLDHVHPTLEANRQLALMVLAQLEAVGVVRPRPEWDPARIAGVKKTLLATLGPRDHGDAFRNISRVLRWGGKFDEAETHMRRAMEIDPTDAERRYLEAGQREAAGEPDAAAELYLRAIALDPGFGRAYVQLGRMMLAEGDSLLALGYFCKALEVQPGHVLAYDWVGQAQDALGRYTDAADTYTYALRLMPDWPEAQVHLGMCRFAMNDSEQSESHYRHALRVDPDFAPAHYNLAFLRFMQGRWNEAVHHYSQVCRLDPEFTPARTKLALAQKQAQLAASVR